MRYLLLLIFPLQGLNAQSLDEIFSAYKIENVTSEAYFQTLNNSTKSNFTLEIGGHELYLTPSNIISENYKCVNSKGVEVGGASNRAIPLRGYTKEGLEVSISIAPNFIYGIIKYPDYEWVIQPLSMYDKNAKANTFITYKSTDQLIKESGTCGVSSSLAHDHHEEIEKERNRSNGACFDVDYAICTDYSMFVKYGSTTGVENQMIAVTNNVNTLYDNEFADAVQFRVSGQVIIDCNGCDPWTSSLSANVLLPNFRTWCINNLSNAPYNITYDISTLWTNRDFSGSTIGLAYTSPALCDNNKTNNILQDYTNNATNLKRLAAHELGHNFSAGHDASGNFVMSGSINNSSDNWSNASINTIEDRYTNNGSCLTTPCAPIIPEISWTTTNATVSEASNSNSSTCGLPYTDIDILLNKSVYTQASVGVNISVVNGGTTANDLDYELLTNSITFTSGGSLNQAVTVRIFDDIVEEPVETLQLTFTISSGSANVGAIQNYTLSIESSGDEVSNDCCSGGQSYTVGNYNLNGSAFTSFGNSRSRSRFMITASELTNAGLSAGEISQLDLYVQTKNSSGPIDNFKIGVANHSGTSLPGSWISTSNIFDQTITTTTGWNVFIFNNVFLWDGTSSLYFDVCFDNGNTDNSDFLRCGITSGNYGGFVTTYSGDICTNSPIGTSSFNYKPQTRLYTNGGAKIETALQASSSGKLATGDIGHFYSDDDEAILSIKNTGQQDIDCIDVSIATSGNGKSNFNFGSDQYTQKTFFIDADNEASYEATLYYKTTELSTWGGNNLNLRMALSSQAFATAAKEDVFVSNPLSVTTNVGAENGIAYKASFTGFGYLALTDAEDNPLPESDSDFIFGTATDGLILTSPNGTNYKVAETAPGLIGTSSANGLPSAASGLDGNVYINDVGSSFTFKSNASGYSKYTVDNNGNLIYNNIGTLPSTRLMIESGNFKISKPGTGLILKAPNSSCFKIGVTDVGLLEVVEIGCP